jgi:hypothetical protein
MKSSMMWMGRAVALALFSMLILAPSPGHSQIPQTINYQGSLTDASGNPITAALGISFRLYDSPNIVGATLLWAETQTVNVANGAFDVVLGADAGNPLAPSLFDIPLYLGIAVGGDAEMIPRQALAAVGYSFRSLMPSGAVMFFDLAACPTGWSELVAAKGRALVGLPDGGTLSGFTGAPLGDLENRLHAHNVDPVPVGSSAVGSHSHSVGPLSPTTTSHDGHTHTVDPAERTSSSDSHNHRWAYIDPNEVWRSYSSAGGPVQMIDYGVSGNEVTVTSNRFAVSVASESTTTRYYYTNNDNHSHTTDIPGFSSNSAGSHAHGVSINTDTGNSGSHGHTVDVANKTSTASGTTNVMPYLQLRVCRKD